MESSAADVIRTVMEVTILASGSSGNALLVRGEGGSLLVDAGLSARKLCSRLEQCGIAPAELSGILLTHEHGDHTRGLKVLLSKNRIPVFANPLTARHLQHSGVEADWNLFESGSTFQIQGFDVHAFSVPHDAADPVGFVLRAGGQGFGVLTDLGYATRQVVESLRGVRAFLVETNHDEELLQKDTKRPWSVKQRILSRHGHLSNAAAAALVADVAEGLLEHVLLGHLSRDCNSPELAVETVGASLRRKGLDHVRVHCASPDEDAPMTRVSLGG